MEEVVQAQNLTKVFNGLVAVDHINFHVSLGECFGVLGPNGAGKTTTVKMIYGFTPMTEGSIRVLGMDIVSEPRRIRAEIGVTPQEDNLDPDFTVLKNLTNFARYFEIPAREARRRAEELLGFLGLSQKWDARIQALSSGMKRRLILARGLINRPRLLIMDEPTTGLDPQARHQIWEKIRELQKAGTTIVLTTHYMEEASQLCGRLIIMDRGRIVEEGTPSELVKRHAGHDTIEIWDYESTLPELLVESQIPHDVFSGRIYISTDSAERDLQLISGHSTAAQMTVRRSSLEDVFLKLTGRGLRE